LIAAPEVALVILAAGLSQRFGFPKLSAPFRAKPLALHAAETLSQVGFGQMICVWSAATGSVAQNIQLLGYRMVEQEDPRLGLGASVALGVRSALPMKPGAILIALADMPLISRRHVVRLLHALGDERGIVASSDGNAVMPPALFGKAHFAKLLNLTGDRGARHLLIGAQLIEADGCELLDVDVPSDAAGVGDDRSGLLAG
jgi:molybdenum cofactor cytidylyltransferase